LVEFLNTGRPAEHPDNESGITMPPKGGNPSLSDDDLADIAAYLRTLN
jgi:disulfide bond formation protein DsbB